MLNERPTPPLRREEAVTHAAASARIEGVFLDAETQTTLRNWADGSLTSAGLEDWVQEQIRQARQTRVEPSAFGAKALG